MPHLIGSPTPKYLHQTHALFLTTPIFDIRHT